MTPARREIMMLEYEIKRAELVYTSSIECKHIECRESDICLDYDWIELSK